MKVIYVKKNFFYYFSILLSADPTQFPGEERADSKRWNYRSELWPFETRNAWWRLIKPRRYWSGYCPPIFSSHGKQGGKNRRRGKDCQEQGFLIFFYSRGGGVNVAASRFLFLYEGMEWTRLFLDEITRIDIDELETYEGLVAFATRVFRRICLFLNFLSCSTDKNASAILRGK